MKDFIEKYGFGVCTYLANRMGIASSKVRLYFIYLSFVTIGSPIIFYLITAFWLNAKNYSRKDTFSID